MTQILRKIFNELNYGQMFLSQNKMVKINGQDRKQRTLIDKGLIN